MAMPMGGRRWAPTRKSSMTVLGKVPKPINLPSQRLENHGFDPNVEIVPKGPHTWGNRLPSTNAWGPTALLSPKADGSSGSPSHDNDRPSSGGSTRPSTAGSDRSHEPAFSARGPNSRPSSASGALTSNQTLTTATRPRSADTRPSSSQLSRFAESPVGVSGTLDRGPASSKTNNFSLSSGDFPILGADKNSELQRGHSSHGRPGSASGLASAPKEALRPLSSGGKNANTYPDRGNVNTWKADDYHPVGGGPSPNMTWQRDPQQAEPYPAANIPPQQFGPWSDAVWYSDGAVGGQCRPPGSYPVDRYVYYPHQFPVRPPPNSDPFPRPGSDPCGYNRKNGDSYHHHQPPDAYMVPGHYPSFPVPGPCDGTFSISNEQEVSVVGKCSPSAVYDQQLSQSTNSVPGKFHARSSVNISVMSRERKESQLHHETRTGQYKVLLKQHDVREGKNDAQEKREQSDVSDPIHLDRGIPPFSGAHEEDWRNNRSDERAVSVPCKEASSQPSSDGKDNSSDSIVTNLLGSPRREVGEEAHSQVHRRTHFTRGRVDQHVRANSQDNDESMKKFIGRDSISHEVQLIDCHLSEGSKEESHHGASSDGLSYVPSPLDSTDRKSERAKLKEKAIRRAKELQLQEEERIREQVAKALAKLEELNKRTSVQSSNNRAHDIPPNNDVQPIESSAGSVGEAYTVNIEALRPSLAQGSDSSLQASECEIKNPAESSESFIAMDPQIPTSGTQDSAILCEPSLLVGRESSRAEATCTSPNLHDSSVTKKQAGSRRPNLSQDESQCNKSKSAEGLGIPNNIDLSVPRLSTDVLPGVMETSVPQRKKNNRNARNKIKPEATNSTVPYTAALEGVQPQDDGHILASVAEATLVSVQSNNGSTVNQDSITSSNQGQLQPTEKIHGRVSNQWRPQTSRKPSKYQPHGSESVVWAPVKPSNKNEPSEELNQRSNPDNRNHSTGKNGSESDPQHVTMIKRVDMERYVPKPVVKEMSQQDSCQEPSSSLDQPGADMVEKPDSGSKISESPGTDAKNGEPNKPNRRAKVRASWRQRGAAELPSALQGSNEGILPSYHTKSVMEPSDQKKPLSEHRKQLLYDDWGSGNDDPLHTEKSTKPVNHGVVMQKVEGSNYAHFVNKDLQKAEQSPALGLNESDWRNPLRSKNQSSSAGGGEQLKSRWQPKYQAYPDSIRNENMGHEGQRFASQGTRFRKDPRSQPIENEEPIQGKGDTKWRKAGPQDNKEYRAIVDQTKEKGRSAGKDLLTDAEISVTKSNSQQEQPPILQGHRDHRSNRGPHHGNLGGRNLGNSHFEYHKVGSYNRANYSDRQNPVIGEETQEGSSRASGLRYKERGPNYSKQGGHFYGQRSAAVQTGELEG